MRGALSLYAFLALGFYLVFPKYDEDGWKAFVPVWRLGVHACHVGMRRLFFALCVVGGLVLVTQLIGYATMGGLAAPPGSGLRTVAIMLGDIGVYLTMALFLLIGPAFLGVLAARTARCFSKPLWFAAGLCLLWPAFMIALGLDRGATYVPVSRKDSPRSEWFVELGFSALAILFTFILFALRIKLGFTLPNQS